MKNPIIVAGLAILVGAIAIAVWVLRPPAEATAPITAVPLAVFTEDTTPEGQTDPAVSTPETPPQSEAESLSGVAVFQISQAGSQARFILNEELRGQPTTVIGTTDQIAGEIALDFDNPQNSQIGVIQVNARTLVTDNNFRNRAIQNEILDTGAFEFITFTPTSVVGLPEEIVVGEPVTLQITGDLTIRNITQQVTFDATATLVALDRLEGVASVTVLRSDYQLAIPSVPSVANVTDEVLLEIEFTAVPK